MTDLSDYKPRFSFEVSREQKKRADRLLGEYGLRRSVFSPILDDVLDLIEEYGGIAIGVMMSGRLKPREIIPTIQKAEEVAKR